jgi:hypothetical protein
MHAPAPPPPRVRPILAFAMAVLAVPILILFGLGLMNDEAVRWRPIIFPTYVLGAWVTPILLWQRLVRRGVPRSDALAAAIGGAVAVLAVDLSIIAGGVTGIGDVLFMLAGAGAATTIAIWYRPRRAQVPPRPDLTS